MYFLNRNFSSVQGKGIHKKRLCWYSLPRSEIKCCVYFIIIYGYMENPVVEMSPMSNEIGMLRRKISGYRFYSFKHGQSVF